MLSRSAQGLYWMGRYLERASHVSRLLRSQMSALVDQPASEIHFGWMRMYRNMGGRSHTAESRPTHRRPNPSSATLSPWRIPTRWRTT